MASSSTIGEIISRDDAATKDSRDKYRLDWRRRSKKELLKEELVPLVPELDEHDVDGTSSLTPAAIVKIVKYLEDNEVDNL